MNDLDVRGKMFINKNSFSGSSFEPKDPNPLPNFTVKTSACEPVDINVYSDAELRMGDGGNHIGDLTISENSKVVIRNGGLLQIKNGSTLIIETGGSLVIEDGASIQLQGKNASILIEDGGELVINGEFDFQGNGYFQFDEGNILTLNSDLVLNGNGKNRRCIRLNKNATLGIGNNGFLLSHGLVEYSNGSSIRIEDGGTVDFSYVKLSGLKNETPNSIGIDSEDSERIDLFDVTISNLEVGIELFYNNNPTQPYVVPGFDVELCRFQNCKIGILGLNELQNIEQIELNISGTLFDGQEYGEIGLWVNGFSNVNIQGGSFQNYNEGIKATNIQSLKISKSRIRNNDIGIFIPEEINVLNKSNVFLSSGASIENNGIGILLEKGGILENENDFGMVSMDCAKLINNDVGIQGVDILLNIDACFNSGQFGTCDNSMIRPNVFINELPAGSLFRICYEDRTDIEEIRAEGNYWSASGQNGLPNHSDHLLRSANSNLPCYGYSDISLITDNNVSTIPSGCGEVVDVITSIPGEIIKDNCFPENNTSELGACMYESGQGEWSLNSRFSNGYKALINDSEGEAMMEYQSLASISNADRNNYCPPCRHYIDVARVMAIGNQGKLGLTSEASNSVVEQSKQIKQHAITASVFPNPVEDSFTLEWGKIIYDLRIVDIYGQVIYSSKNNAKLNLDVKDWQSGIYILQLEDVDSSKLVKRKLVVK